MRIRLLISIISLETMSLWLSMRLIILGRQFWKKVRDRLVDRLVVQFTATPFRQDGKHMGGEILYSYPLARAQSERYFSTISFSSNLQLRFYSV